MIETAQGGTSGSGAAWRTSPPSLEAAQGSQRAAVRRRTTDTAASADAAVYLNCPRCGLSIRRRVDWLTVEHCPRCVGRAGLLVDLFVSARPNVDWYRQRPEPDANPAPIAIETGGRL